MKLFSKINDRLSESSNWILNSPESLTLLMLMGSGIASLFFSTFSIVMIIYKNFFFVILFGFFAYASIKQFIKLLKSVRKLGLRNALGGYTANLFVWHKNKYGGKEDGKSDRTIKADEICGEQNVRSNEVCKERNGTNSGKSKRTNAWSRIMLERTDGNMQKTKNGKR